MVQHMAIANDVITGTVVFITEFTRNQTSQCPQENGDAIIMHFELVWQPCNALV